MKTHTTPTGIELLMPLVPRYADDISLGDLNHEDKYFILYYYLHLGKYIDLPYSPKKDWNDYTILGTCWREGDNLVCEGFYPSRIMIKQAPVPLVEQVVDPQEEEILIKHLQNIGLIQMDLWLRSEGITMPEGMKAVIIKVN